MSARWSLITLAFAGAAMAQVTLRGGQTLDDVVQAVSIEGVTVGEAPSRVLAWDQVREIEGEHADSEAEFADLAEKCWRARTRLARGDVAMAQPLFEELFEIYEGVDGPTALLVAQGLLECRLANLAQPAAVSPWLETLRLMRSGAHNASRPSALDPETLLAPNLPPIWLESSAVSALALESYEQHDDPVVRALARLYIDSAGGAHHEPEGPAANDRAVTLVSNMVAAASGDAQKRAVARQWLRAGLSNDQGTWREAWRRAALGHSLLLEPDLEDRRSGMVHLLHIPARFANSQRYLTGVAMALVADELRRQGQDAQAARLEIEIREYDAAHPALHWLERRQVTPIDATAHAIRAHKESP